MGDRKKLLKCLDSANKDTMKKKIMIEDFLEFIQGEKDRKKMVGELGSTNISSLELERKINAVVSKYVKDYRLKFVNYKIKKIEEWMDNNDIEYKSLGVQRKIDLDGINTKLVGTGYTFGELVENVNNRKMRIMYKKYRQENIPKFEIIDSYGVTGDLEDAKTRLKNKYYGRTYTNIETVDNELSKVQKIIATQDPPQLLKDYEYFGKDKGLKDDWRQVYMYMVNNKKKPLNREDLYKYLVYLKKGEEQEYENINNVYKFYGEMLQSGVLGKYLEKFRSRKKYDLERISREFGVELGGVENITVAKIRDMVWDRLGGSQTKKEIENKLKYLI